MPGIEFMQNGLKTGMNIMDKNFELCYETLGDPKNPSMILIMGIGGQLIHWPEKLIQGLVNKGFYVVIFDNRDSGLSRHYDHIETPTINEVMEKIKKGEIILPPYTLEDMASDVISLMNELNTKKAHIVGISMGGMIAQLIALNYPEHVLSLTCIASSSGDQSLPPARPQVMALFFSQKSAANDLESYIDNRVKLYKIYNHPDHFDEENIRAMCIKTYKRSHDAPGFNRQLFAIMHAKSRTQRLKQLQIPSLVIHGDYDSAFPLEHGKQLAACLPNSRLEIIPKMGHGLPECLCDKLVDLITNMRSQ